MFTFYGWCWGGCDGFGSLWVVLCACCSGIGLGMELCGAVRVWHYIYSLIFYLDGFGLCIEVFMVYIVWL